MSCEERGEVNKKDEVNLEMLNAFFQLSASPAFVEALCL